MRQFVGGGNQAFAELAQRATQSCVVFRDQELPPGSDPSRGRIGFAINADQGLILARRLISQLLEREQTALAAE